jgi:hypothetical protein
MIFAPGGAATFSVERNRTYVLKGQSVGLGDATWHKHEVVMMADE